MDVSLWNFLLESMYLCTLIVGFFLLSTTRKNTQNDMDSKFVSPGIRPIHGTVRVSPSVSRLRYESPVPIRQSIIINSISRANRWVRRKPLNRPTRSLDALEPTQTRSPLYPHNRTTTPMVIVFSLIFYDYRTYGTYSSEYSTTVVHLFRNPLLGPSHRSTI